MEEADGFVRRHIGPSETELTAMLRVVAAAALDNGVKATTLDDLAGKGGTAFDPVERGAGVACAS